MEERSGLKLDQKNNIVAATEVLSIIIWTRSE